MGWASKMDGQLNLNKFKSQNLKLKKYKPSMKCNKLQLSEYITKPRSSVARG